MNKKQKQKILIIADIGHNHNGDMGLAKRMIDMVKASGADIAKFQLYDVDKLNLNEEEKAKGVYADLKKGQLTREQVKILASYCKEVKIEFLCSVFDAERVAWTEEVGMERYKIASRSIYDKELIEAIRKTKKEIIVSDGMVGEEGIPEEFWHDRILYCVSKYPTDLRDLDWVKMGRFDSGKGYDGFSDHTLGSIATVMAVSRGAKIIEKHFTIDGRMDGCDQAMSMTPPEFMALVKSVRMIENILYAE